MTSETCEERQERGQLSTPADLDTDTESKLTVLYDPSPSVSPTVKSPTVFLISVTLLADPSLSLVGRLAVCVVAEEGALPALGLVGVSSSPVLMPETAAPTAVQLLILPSPAFTGGVRIAVPSPDDSLRIGGAPLGRAPAK